MAGRGYTGRVKRLSERGLPGKYPQKALPTCVIIDTQSVKNAATATGATVGFDAGKLVKGRKRLVRIDTLGNVLASRVVPAHVSDAAAHPLLALVQVVMGDNSFAGLFTEHLAHYYCVRFEKPVHIVLKKKNFCIPRKRWLVERTLAWLSANRCLSKECDRLLTRANAWIMWANIRRILKFR
ncbi:MAG: transposase [Janthinobacterium lividum]